MRPNPKVKAAETEGLMVALAKFELEETAAGEVGWPWPKKSLRRRPVCFIRDSPHKNKCMGSKPAFNPNLKTPV